MAKDNVMTDTRSEISLARRSGKRSRRVFHYLYIIFGLVTICVPFFAHSKEDCPGQSGWKHARIFHYESLPPKNIFKEQVGDSFTFERCPLEGHEVWEAAAIVQALLFSILLLGETEERRFRKLTVIPLILILFFNLTTLGVLFMGVTWLYQVLILITILGFCVEDYCLHLQARRNSDDTRLYKMLLSYVDLPILVAMILLCLHLGVPYQEGSEKFFAGAVAFQLIFGNVAIFMIRQYKDVEEAGGVKDLMRSLVRP